MAKSKSSEDGDGKPKKKGLYGQECILSASLAEVMGKDRVSTLLITCVEETPIIKSVPSIVFMTYIRLLFFFLVELRFPPHFDFGKKKKKKDKMTG